MHRGTMRPGLARWGVTGHRAKRLGIRDDRDQDELDQFAMLQLIEHANGLDHRVEIVTGLAQGWDQAVAVAAIRLRLPYVAFIPCVDQHLPWPIPTWRRYFGLLSRAQRVEYVSTDPYKGPQDMHRRNERIVSQSEHILALWDGGADGGTANCLGLATERKRDIVNTWMEWVEFRTAGRPAKEK